MAYALTAQAALQVGARALAIKGLVSSAHGLRDERTPADVDVLVEPNGFQAVTQQLEAWGWRDRLGDSADFPFTQHSVTYIHDRWPCDIDIHHRFPGFLASPHKTFDALWERRVVLSVAGRLVPVTDWASSVAIMALHSVRSTPDNPRHTDELRHLVDLSRTWTQHKRTDLATIALATGCVQSLDEVWPRLGVTADSSLESVAADDLAEWRLKLEGRVPGIRVWLRYLREGGARQALGRLGTALWLPEALMRASGQIAESEFALFRARVARLWRMLWGSPRSLLAMARGGAGVSRKALGRTPPT